MPRRWGALAAIALLAIVGCSGDDNGDDAAPATTAADSSAPDATPAPDGVVAAIEDDGGGPDCDPTDPRACLLPFPSNRFTVESPDTDTGLLVALPESGMPVNVDGVVADPTEWNRNDGFSPGTALLTQVPGLDVEASGLPAITDIPDSRAEDSPVVVVDTETGERQPVWAELDSGAEADEDRLLFIRPGVNYLEGHHYVVGLRDLVSDDGEALEPSAGFLVYRDNLTTDLPVIEDRARRHGAGVHRPGRGRRGPGGPVPGLGLHDRQRAEPVRAPAPHPGRRLRRPGRGRPRVHRGRRRPGPGGGRRGVRPRDLPGAALPDRRRGRRHPVRQRCRWPAQAQRRLHRRLRVRPAHRHRGGRPHGALRPRPPRQPGRGGGGQHRRLRPRAPGGVLCHRLDRDVRGRRRQRGVDPGSARGVPDAGRPLPAGDPELPVPGPVDAARGRPDQCPRVPEPRGSEARHQRPGLRRQQPGRDHGWGGHGRGPGLDPRRARRTRHELLAAPAPQRRLRHLCRHPRPRLPGPGRAEPGPVDRPDALGPGRERRVRPAPDP